MADTSIDNLKQQCSRWLSFDKNNDNVSLKQRHAYYGQVQLGMALLNLQNCDFLIYASGDGSIKVINVDIDVEFIKKMLLTVKQKYFTNMFHNICKQSKVPLKNRLL